MKNKFQSKAVPRGTRTIWRYLSALFILFTFAIGNVWGAVIDLTPDAEVTGTNKKWKEVGGGYVSRNGGGFTISTDGLQTGSGNTYVVFDVAAASTIEAKFINTSTTAYSDKTICCGKVSSTQWTAITDAVSDDTQYQLTIASGDKLTDQTISLPGTKSATTSCTFTATAAGKYAVYWTSSINNKVRLYEIEITASGGGGGDPVDPTLEYSAGAYTIGATALDLSSCIKTKQSTGAITYSVKTDGGTSATITGTSFTAENAGTCVVTASQAEVSGTYNAASADFNVVVSAPDPCTSYFWFAKSADATTAGKTNWDGFTITQSGSSNNTSGSKITIDGTDYAVSGRTSSNVTANIATFTVPANKAGKFYALLQSSGSTTRTIYLKQGDNTLQTLTDAVAAGNGNDAALSEVVIDNIPAGTYSVIANNNTRIGMLALKVCDATYHTITFDLNGGTGTTSIAALDGVPAIKPADPTKEHADFVKWIVKSTEADYNWSANVTGDLTLKAVWSNWPTLTLAAGEGATGDPIANQCKAGTEITVPEKPEGFSKGTDVFTGWAYSQVVTVTDGKFDMPSTDLTLTAQWQAPSDFDVKFFQGYGEPDAQIGETQSISTGNYATAPEDPVRAGFAFLGWSYDATEAHIVDVATYGITAATNFTAIWKQVFAVTFDGAGEVNVEDGKKVASPNSPVMAGKVFQGWYNGESKYDFSAAVTSALALTSKWVDADPNHFVYAYNDDFHFDGVVYKTPEGKVDNNDLTSNKAITTPYTLFSGAGGITSIVATGAIYDSKGTHVNAFLKLDTKASSYLTVTIASGYTAVMKVKMGSWNVGSAAPTVTFVDEDDTPVSYTGTMEGKAEDNNYAELTYNLSAGTYKMTTATKTLYFSNMDIEATALPTHTVTYKAGEGTGDDVEDADATNVADVPSTFTAPTGKVFNGWKDESDNDVAVGAIVEADMTLTAQWINHYAVTFNMNGHGDAPAEQDIKHGEKAAKPADPSEIGWIFGGWFTDNGTFEAPFDFETPITAATPLFAKWTEDPCPTPFSLSKVVLTSATDGTVTGYNNDEYAGEKVIGGLNSTETAEVDPSHEGAETGYKLNNGGSAIVFATLKKGTFQVGDRVVVTITKAQDAYKVEEVAQPILDIYYGTDKNDATFLTTIENVTAAGTYTYRLTAADVTAIGNKKGIGVFRPSSGRTQNPYVYSVEIKGCREWAIFHTLTFKNIDGTATIAAESLEEGAAASTIAPTAPKIAMKRFLGWAEATDGTPVDLTTYTITEDKILYAVYEDIVCPTNGTVYKFEIKDELPSENLPTSTDKDMSSYITATGDGYLTYTATADNKATINSDGTIQLKDATAAYLKVELECALAAGDQIRAHVTNNPIRVQVGTTYDSNKDLILAKNAYEFVAITSAMEGKQVLYITRSSNGNAYLADFEIYRPAKFDVSFNMMGHGTQIADIEDVIEGSKITAPTAPTDEDYSFAGWYKENTFANEWKFDVDVVETNTTLYAKWLDKSDATLKSLKYGETEIALEAGIYTYNVSLPAFTSAVPALTAETSNPNATKVIANAAAFDSEGNATSTVTVTPEVGADQVYTVKFAKGVEILLQDVTGSITWNFANAVTANVSITETPQVLANYGGVTNDNTFESDKLEASGEKFTAGSNANLRANYIHFHTTVPGILSISYSNTGGSNPARYIYVNGVKYDEEGSASTTKKGLDTKVFVPAGDVELVMKDGEDASKNVQIYQMIFNATPDYTRPVTEGRYGTICLPNGGVMTGATIFEIAYMDYKDNKPYKIYFDEVLNGTMVAGMPYIFLPNESATQLGVFYTDAADAEEGHHNGLYGKYTKTLLVKDAGNYILKNNQYWYVNSDNVYCDANRAYIVLADVPDYDPGQPAYGRRRIALSVNNENQAQGFENIETGDAPMKIMIEGQMYILRGERVYDATGRLVK